MASAVDSLSISRISTARCRPILVLGADRSGTSLISEITYRWGANAGDISALGGANDGNPQGYWEYEPMEALLDRLFKSAGVPIWHPDFPTRMRSLAKDPVLRDDTLALAASMEDGPAWFWKEPNICPCLPFFLSLIESPIFIVAVRNPYDSAISYEKLVVPPTMAGSIRLRALYLLRWQHYVLSILDGVAANPSTIYVPYDDLVNDPSAQCERLCAFLDRECGLGGDPSARLRRMVATVDPALRRNRAGRQFETSDDATSTQRDLFRHLLERVDKPNLPFSRAAFPMPPGSREYLGNADLMLSMLRKL